MNTIFQFIWFYFVKPAIKRKEGDGTSLIHYHKCLITQIKLAKRFGIKYLIVGDSNGENLATYSNMKQLGKGLNAVIANIAIGGTRADTWYDYFYSDEGKELLSILPEDTFIIFNIGGNHILQDKMDLLPSAFKSLKAIVKRKSCNCLVPPIHTKFIQVLNSEISNETIKLCNKMIKSVWPKMFIDVYTPFVTKDGDPLFFLHDDIVHFSDNVDKNMRIPIMIDAIKSFVK